MSKLKKEELSSIIETAFSHLLKDINYKETKAKYEQAHQQIRELIQKPGVTEEELFDIKAQEYERGLKDAQPAVDEGFVNTWAKELEKDLLPYSVCVDIDKEKLKYMLREAGVEVVKK